MDEMKLGEDNFLWLVNNQTSLMSYSEGCLADQVFNLATTRMREERRGIIDDIIAACPALVEIAKGLKKSQRLKLVFSDEVKKKLADGTYKLMKCTDTKGVFKAVIVNSKGKIQAIPNLKIETVFQGINYSTLMSSMQGITAQQHLNDIISHLETMSKSIEDVLMGQYNDRLALFYAGEAIYREALASSDEDRRRQLSSASIVSLTNSIAALQTSLQYEVQGICDKYNGEKKRFVKITAEELKSKMYLINSSYQAIHKAVTLKAAIYYNEGEYAALTTVLSDYKAFLERCLSDDRAQILYLADPTDKSINGVWASRKNELPESIEKARMALSRPADYAIEVTKGDLG